VSSLRYVLSAFLAIGCLSANAVTLPSVANESAATQNQAQFDDFRGDHSIVIYLVLSFSIPTKRDEGFRLSMRRRSRLRS
jgi:hypothetical protein